MISWHLLYGIDLLALAYFALSYYRDCYSKGYRIDFWHTQIFLVCVLPNFLMLPFAASELNRLVLGNDYPLVAAAVPVVFQITVLGFAAVLLGGSIWRIRIGLGIRHMCGKVLDVVPNCSMQLMSSRTVLVSQTLICLLLQTGILIIRYQQEGFNFDIRSYGFANPALRPIIQTVSFYSTIIASHCIARYIDCKEKILLLCNVCLAFGMLLFGSRGGLLTIYLNVLICCLMRRRRKLGIVRLVVLAASIVLVTLYMGNIRSGHYSLSEFFSDVVFLLLYGNNFSDLRDFAWVYACWDHVFWFGKTYLAALMAFVPRFVSSFRDTWGVGVATASTVGFDPELHPGLRPGSFGESFFNFGPMGVIVAGVLIGIVVRRVDNKVKLVLQSSDPSIMQAFAFTMLLNISSTFAMSVNSSTLYVMGGVYAISWVCLRGVRLLKVSPPQLQEVTSEGTL